jgi:hypothetical protein
MIVKGRRSGTPTLMPWLRPLTRAKIRSTNGGRFLGCPDNSDLYREFYPEVNHCDYFTAGGPYCSNFPNHPMLGAQTRLHIWGIVHYCDEHLGVVCKEGWPRD